jgi:hypothetical protein
MTKKSKIYAPVLSKGFFAQRKECLLFRLQAFILEVRPGG